MKFKIAIEVELDLSNLTIEMVESNPAVFCKEFAETLVENAAVEVAEQGAILSYKNSAWMSDKNNDYDTGILNYFIWRD